MGELPSYLRTIAMVSREGGGQLRPEAGDLALTVGWGYAGKGRVVMPGVGKIVERAYSDEERNAIAEGAAAAGLTLDEALAHLGATANDVYLNGVAYWRNVPSKVWAYRIGGYQVMKKWLSYRERELLGRDLTPGEVREVRDRARRIAAILLLEPELDANNQAVKAATWA